MVSHGGGGGLGFLINRDHSSSRQRPADMQLRNTQCGYK